MLIDRDLSLGQEKRPVDQPAENKVEYWPCQDHQEALPCGTQHEPLRFGKFRVFIHALRTFASKAHIPSQGQCGKAVFGHALAALEQHWPKAQGKGFDPHTQQPGHEEVSKFMEKN